MKVPFFNYPKIYLDDKKSFNQIFERVATGGGFIMQEDLSNFEKEIATYCNCNYAIGVGNATDALEMLVSIAGINKEHEVILSSHTMVATASAIYINGAKPIPVEIGDDHLIDVSSIINNLSPKTKAILVTQLNGRTANMDEILKIVDENNLILIEDSAQALGSRFKGKHAGTFGFGGCISFYPAKLLGCFGDGGMILVNDKNIYEKLLLMRDHGRDPLSGDVVLWGRNSRLDNFQAAVLSHQFKYFEKTVNRRREIASIYNDELARIDSLILPPPPNSNDHYDVYQNYELKALNRDNLRKFLNKNEIGTSIQWGGKALHHFKKLGFNQSLPNTDAAFKKMLMLPMNMSLTNDDVYYVCEKVEKFYAK